MAEDFSIKLNGVYARKDNEQNYTFYKFCYMDQPDDVRPGQGYTQNPVKGSARGFNFGRDFIGASVGESHRYTLKNGNYFTITLSGIYDPTSETLEQYRQNFSVNFTDLINTWNTGTGFLTTLGPETMNTCTFYIGLAISSNSAYPPTNACGKFYAFYKSTYQEGFPSLAWVHSDAIFWVTTGSGSVLTEWDYNGTTIPPHAGFDPFKWAGDSGDIDNGDPYNPGDESGDGGGEGDFDGDSDPIDFPDLPDISVVDTGFVNLFNPTIAQLQALANYMWSDLFSIDTFKKIFADPMDCILGLSIVPVTVPDGGLSPVTVGNISTGVNLNKAGAQYVEIDCGTLNVNEYWGAYLDYSPYTNVQIYLPYIGFQHLNIDDVMKKAVHVKYHVDILSGSLCAYVKCGDSVLYTYTGQCSLTIPVNANNFTQMITSIASGLISTGVSMASGGIGGAVGSGLQSAISVASSKPTVERSGQLTGMGGILGIQKPYMILTRPRQCLPRGQNGFTGYPSYITATLSSVSGYTEVAEIHLENVPATSEELAEIEQLLRNGVII